MALNRVHEYYRCKKVTEEFMENARIARALVGPVAAKGWVTGARNHNRYAIEAKRDSRKYLSKIKAS